MLALIHPTPGTIARVDRPDPSPGPRQVLVAVHASGINRADLLQRAGKYAAPPEWPADIPGLEYAGEVTAIGSEVSRWQPGDRVMGLVGGGAHADLLVVDEREVMALPAGLSFVQGAAIPEAFLTAWDAIVLHGRAVSGERILMHAIGSGVGTAAVQLARAYDLELIGTSRTAVKLERCAALGLRHGVLTTDADWPAKVGDPIDVLVDPLGAEYFSQNLALLANQGRMIVLGTMTGAIGPAIDLGALLRRRLEVIGTAMRVRRSGERARLVARFTEEVLPFFRDGELVPVVDRVMDAADATAAYDLVAGNTTFGKVILRHR